MTGPTSPRQTFATLVTSDPTEYLFISDRFPFSFSTPPDISYVTPKVINNPSQHLIVMMDDYIIISSDDVLCRLKKENGNSVTLNAEVSPSGYELICLLLSADGNF